MAYLLDSDVFIRAKNDHFGFDFCPAFWNWLEQASAIGVVGSVEAVYNELVAGDDALVTWVKEHRSMFLPLTEKELPAVTRVNRWANDSPDYEAAAKVAFASAADSFLIGHATAGSHIVVTHEQISDSRRKIKIPNAAIANGVTVVNPFQMLRAEQVRFVLADGLGD